MDDECRKAVETLRAKQAKARKPDEVRLYILVGASTILAVAAAVLWILILVSRGI